MAVRSLLRSGRSLPPGRFLVLISVRDRVDPTAIVRLEGLSQLKTNDLIGNLTVLTLCPTAVSRDTWKSNSYVTKRH
jgi:hypothetical protein